MHLKFVLAVMEINTGLGIITKMFQTFAVFQPYKGKISCPDLNQCGIQEHSYLANPLLQGLCPWPSAGWLTPWVG